MATEAVVVQENGGDLTLFEISRELLDAVADVDASQHELDLARTGGADSEEIARLEGERDTAELVLREYVAAEARKVDRIAGFLRWCQTNADLARAERDRIADRVRTWERREDRLKRMVLDVMRAFDVKRFETPLNVLRRQANGGAVSPVIEDEGRIPARLMRATVVMTLDQLEAAKKAHPGLVIQKLQVEPIPAAIAAALKAGSVPGARPGERGEHLRCE